MEKSSAPLLSARVMRKGTPGMYKLAFSIFFITTAFVSFAQRTPATIKDHKSGILSIAYFVESANNSINSLNSLLKKDNYRNKITTLNNPANNELGFNLRTEILAALSPMLAKTKKTDTKKFTDVVDNLLSNPEEKGLTPVVKYLPAVGLFSAVLSLVGNLVIHERKVTKEDLEKFTTKIQQYFSQYEKLNRINEQFGSQVAELLEKSEEIKSDLKDFLIESICAMNKGMTRLSLKDFSLEALTQKYYDPQKLSSFLDTCRSKNEMQMFPPDAPTSVKLLTSSIKKLQKEFEAMYGDNYKALKELILSLKTTIPGLDENQLNKTNSEIDQLYNDSRQADMINLNIALVDERMNMVCRTIHTGK
jgi:hypothetical protein